MQKQLAAWQFIQRNLQLHVEVMLLYVLESKGSSPGRQGFIMAVNGNGEMCGSLGGGIMEHKFVELAKTRLQQAARESSVHLQLHDKQAAKNQSGMICSGEQTIFLYTLHGNDLAPVDALVESLQEHRNGTLQLTMEGISFEPGIPSFDYQFQLNSPTAFTYREKTGYKNNLYIIGGGHCALALSQLMRTMDFYIHLFDERAGLNTMEENIFVHEKTCVDDYAQLAGMIIGGKNCYTVIMTVGYRTDAAALKALSGKEFSYLGMLGSKTKVGKMLQDLRAEGLSQALLDQIHAPIGLPIKSQTPEEIAVSIAAEVIAVKNKNL